MDLLLREEREAVVEYGRKLVTCGLTRGTGGNVSVLGRERGFFAISPSGMDYFEVEPEDVVVMNLEGRIVDGTRKPSSESEMHRLLYRDREDVSAVIHTHSPFATALACTKEVQSGGAPPVHYLAALAGPDLRCLPYYPFGSEKLSQTACVGMRGRRAVLLGNHGVLAAGESAARAFAVAEEIEFVCELYYRARTMGTPALLHDADVRDAAERFRSYGQGS